MRLSNSMQSVARFTFIATSALVLIAGVAWGIRLYAMHFTQANQAVAQSAHEALLGFPMPGRLAPDLTLVDQFDKQVSLSSLRGHEVVMAFIDSRCTTLCPLTANIMYTARSQLGSSAASQVELIAVNANPAANSVATVQAWSIEHGMLHQWLFLTGTAIQLQAVYSSYQVYDQVSSNGAVAHDAAMFIIDAQGRERLYFETLDSSAKADLGSEEAGLVIASFRDVQLFQISPVFIWSALVRSPPMRFLRRVAWVAVVATYFLIALGGPVLAPDSGLSCPDWPLCNGKAYYSGTYHVFLEQFHRITAATVSILIVLLFIGIIVWAKPLAWRRS